MRLFIASPVILQEYASIRKDFGGILEGRWVAEENLHLTWVFLGEVNDPEESLGKLRLISCLESDVGVAELGYFGRPPRILFAKSVEEKLIYDKAQEFKSAGFDLYRFKPHITLCRIKKIHDYRAYKETMNHYRKKTLGTIISEIVLYESILTHEGPKYHQVESQQMKSI